MWICLNCGTENENNFKFCWSCGRTREESKPVVKEIPKNPESVKTPNRETKPIREIKHVEEIEPVEITKTEKRKPTRSEPELFSSVVPYSAKASADLNGESDWEVKVFRTALRLAGLFLLYQVFVALPELLVLIYSSVENSAEFSEAMTKVLIIPAAKILFYFVAGIYLIASGKILLRLLPRG